MTKVTLNTKTTAGDLAWNKYVLNNPDWKELELDVVDKTYILNKNGSRELELFPDDKIGILETNELQDVLSVPSKNKFGTCYFAFTDSGYTSIYFVRKPTKTNVMRSEQIAIKKLDEDIKNFKRPIDIVCCGKTYKEIVGCRNVEGTPKADIALYDIDMNDKIFISHKKFGGPKAFQQYAGISKLSGLNDHPEVVEFLSDVDYLVKDKLDHAIYRFVISDDLKCKSIFGKDYGGEFGINNCQIVGQGVPSVLFDYGAYRICWSDRYFSNEDGPVTDPYSGKLDYYPVMGVTFRNGRKIDTKFGPIYNVRGGIYPLGCVKNRTNAMVI